jgi:hypothetical protein
MITGRRGFSADPALKFAPWWKAAIGVVIAVVLMWLISKGLRLPLG